jgi:RNA polymerase sigma factor for flagellar operon FliA
MPDNKAAEVLSDAAVERRGSRDASSEHRDDIPAYFSEPDETEIIRRYVPLVKRAAMHLKGRLPETVQLDDLIQAGLIAVLRIMRHSGNKQITDASLRRSIMNAMIDEARREAWAPVRTVRLAKGAARAMRDVRRRTGRDGSDEQIAAEMGIALAEYHRVLVEIAGLRLLHIDEFDESSEEGLQVGDDQETAFHQNHMMAALAEAITVLPERERMVVSLYYEHELNMDEVGQVLGVNKSTVCRAHGRALLLLRGALADWSAPTAESSAQGE